MTLYAKMRLIKDYPDFSGALIESLSNIYDNVLKDELHKGSCPELADKISWEYVTLSIWINSN